MEFYIKERKPDKVEQFISKVWDDAYKKAIDDVMRIPIDKPEIFDYDKNDVVALQDEINKLITI